MRCLVVHESLTLRRILTRSALELGCEEVVEAADGAAALDRLATPFDAVVTGRSLPGLGGLDLVRRLRADPTTRDVRVLMLAEHSARADVEEAAAAGVNAYLLKPFTPEALRRQLELLLRAPTPAQGQDELKAAA